MFLLVLLYLTTNLFSKNINTNFKKIVTGKTIQKNQIKTKCVNLEKEIKDIKKFKKTYIYKKYTGYGVLYLFELTTSQCPDGSTIFNIIVTAVLFDNSSGSILDIFVFDFPSSEC